MGVFDYLDAASAVSTSSRHHRSKSKHGRKSSRHRSRSRGRSKSRHHSRSRSRSKSGVRDKAASVIGYLAGAPPGIGKHYAEHAASKSTSSFFGLGNGSRGSFLGIGRPSYYKRSPRSSFLHRAYKKLKRILRDLLHYAKRHPWKVFMLVLMPLITTGALAALLARFGLRLPQEVEKWMGIAAKAGGGDTIGLVGEAAKMAGKLSGGGGMAAAAAAAAGGMAGAGKRGGGSGGGSGGGRRPDRGGSGYVGAAGAYGAAGAGRRTGYDWQGGGGYGGGGYGGSRNGGGSAMADSDWGNWDIGEGIGTGLKYVGKMFS